MQIGILGLGKMGARIAEKIVRDGHKVVVWNRSANAIENFKLQVKDVILPGEVDSSLSIKELVGKLRSPRIIWLMVPAGSATQTILDELVEYLVDNPVILNPYENQGEGSLAGVEKSSKDSSALPQNDIIIDGGNAFYKDTERRSEELRAKGIGFLGIGVSGGIKAFENGYPLMVGGDKSAYEIITPILNSLGKPNGGHVYFGEGGAGHFIKMVHNGIEYGMMQAIGEGFGVLEKAPYKIELAAVAQLWQKGTIISSFLMDCAKDALVKNPELSTIDGVIDATGEAEWTVKQGKEENVPVENIEQSLDFRRRSQIDTNISGSFAARMVSALRREFGGHTVKQK